MKATPGPWAIKRAAIRVDGAYDYAVSSAKGQIIAETFGRSSVTDYHDAEANARLIAAAPDLLEALKAATGYLENARIDLETGAPKTTAIATIKGGLAVARAALLKAEGAD